MVLAAKLWHHALVAGKEPDTGPTAATVAHNVERLRKALGMNFTQLSEALQSRASWSINAVGIRRIESGERRVTTDDLMALAVALGVSPVTLLMPNTTHADDKVSATGLVEAKTSRVVWEWLTASEWAYFAIQDTQPTRPSAFFELAWPHWLWEWMRDSRNVEVIDRSWTDARDKAQQQLLDGHPQEIRRGDDQ